MSRGQESGTTGTVGPDLDRPARIRQAIRALVAERGFHGATMQAVARQAGVAAGTAYVHYDSKDALVADAYGELKSELSAAAVVDVDLALPATKRFLALWHNIHRYLAEAPERARFLLQVDVSPFAEAAHGAVLDHAPDDPLVAAMSDIMDELVELPPLVQFDLAVGPVIRLVASGAVLDRAALDRLAGSCWRAVRR